MFLRKTKLARDPLAVTMSGVRLGERALQIGEGDARLMALIAAKTGLTGTATIVVLHDDSASRVRAAIDDSGAVADVAVADRGQPPDDASYDLIVVHDVPHTIASDNTSVRSGWLQLCHRALRAGGRIVAIEAGTAVGFRGLFSGGARKAGDSSAGAIAALRSAGFANVRLLGDREGVRFVEGLKAN